MDTKKVEATRRKLPTESQSRAAIRGTAEVAQRILDDRRKRASRASLKELKALRKLAPPPDKQTKKLINALYLVCKGKSDLEIALVSHEVRRRLMAAMSGDGTYDATKRPDFDPWLNPSRPPPSTGR
jgi:hypothetical protein